MIGRHYNLLQAKSLPEGLTKPLMHALTSTVGVSGSDRGLHFFDIRVCHLNTDSYRDLSPKQIYRIHENEKKRKYIQLSRHRNRVRHIHPTGIYNDGRDG